jgi:hypothetical protein
LNLEDPEHMASDNMYKETPTDTVLNLIEQHLNMDLNFPNIFDGEVGIRSKRGIIHYRAI